MKRNSVDNTRMGLVVSLWSNSNHLISFIPPTLPQILDIYSVVALYSLTIVTPVMAMAQWESRALLI